MSEYLSGLAPELVRGGEKISAKNFGKNEGRRKNFGENFEKTYGRS
jgi:hypothetical protein